MTDKKLIKQMDNPERILEVRHLKKYFPITKGFLKKHSGDVRAVDDLNLYINKGETLGPLYLASL